MKIRAIEEKDRGWVQSLLHERWGSTNIVTRGRVHQAEKLPGFIAHLEEQPKGFITYQIENEDCEIVSLDSLESGRGIGSTLIKSVIDLARSENCNRVWLITTNDNTEALRFYQKIGFELVDIHRNAIKESRKLKPEIPEKGNDGIPIRDEIELEIVL